MNHGCLPLPRLSRGICARSWCRAPKKLAFDASRTFRRLPPGTPYAQIINFQSGEQFMERKFTVNLAVYDPDGATFFVVQETNGGGQTTQCHREGQGGDLDVRSRLAGVEHS